MTTSSAPSSCALPPPAFCANQPTATAILRRHGALLISISVLTAVLYAKVLGGLFADWWKDPDYKHGFLVPLFVAYVLWRERDRYRGVALAPNNWGAAVIFSALALLVAGTLAADAFLTRISLCILIAGITLFIAGTKMLRALGFPLGYLVLMIPLPLLVYNQVTFPLQLFASRIAGAWIEAVGIPVFRQGNILAVPHYSAEVAAACSGIRSLLSLIALSAAYGYIAEQRVAVRIGLVVLTVPLAVLANAARITATSLIGYRFGPPWAEGFVHLFSGWVIFLVALLLLIPLSAALTRICSLRYLRSNA